MSGVGDCPKREFGLGHVWGALAADPNRSCVYCGRHGREVQVPGRANGGFFAEATMARSDRFARLKAPMQSGTGDSSKAFPKGMDPETAARLAKVREDIARDDSERPWLGEGADRRRVQR